MYRAERVHQRGEAEGGLRFAVSLGRMAEPNLFGFGFLKNQFQVVPNGHAAYIEWPEDGNLVLSRAQGRIEPSSDYIPEEGPWQGVRCHRWIVHEGTWAEFAPRFQNTQTCGESVMITV